MKLIKSDCEKAWFFDCHVGKNYLEAGLACFLPLAPDTVAFTIKDKQYSALTPSKAVEKLGAVRIANARLPLLDLKTQ